jgi:hypothetical protein
LRQLPVHDFAACCKLCNEYRNGTASCKKFTLKAEGGEPVCDLYSGGTLVPSIEFDSGMVGNETGLAASPAL